MTESDPGHAPTSPRPAASWVGWDAPTERWMLSGFCRDTHERGLLIELVARIVFPTVLVLAVYLLFAGHERTGGGFSGGLVAGQAFAMRYLAGGRMDDSAIVSLRPPMLIGLGLVVVTLTSFVPLLHGGALLESSILTFTLPLLGKIKLVTSIFLDVGVFILIIGAVLDLLRTLGSAIEADVAAAAREDA